MKALYTSVLTNVHCGGRWCISTAIRLKDGFELTYNFCNHMNKTKLYVSCLIYQTSSCHDTCLFNQSDWIQMINRVAAMNRKFQCIRFSDNMEYCSDNNRRPETWIFLNFFDDLKNWSWQFYAVRTLCSSHKQGRHTK